MERRTWTDERIDDLAHTLDSKFDLVIAELHGLRRDMREDMREMRAEIAAVRRATVQIGIGLTGAVIAALATLLAASL